MSNKGAHLPDDCYGLSGFWMGGLLAKPSSDILAWNLNRLLMARGRGATAALARHCMVNASTISRIRDGEIFVSSDLLDKIATFFKVPVQSLFIDPTDSRHTGMSVDIALAVLSEAVDKLKEIESETDD